VQNIRGGRIHLQSEEMEDSGKTGWFNRELVGGKQTVKAANWSLKRQTIGRTAKRGQYGVSGLDRIRRRWLTVWLTQISPFCPAGVRLT
jgi:hypothetical protein